MAGVFLAAPGYQPLPADFDVNWSPIRHSWQAWDGTMWDLSTGQSGLYLRPGVRGMGMPPVIRYAQKSPAVAGSYYRGSVVDERDVFWPVKLFRNTGSQDWIDHAAAFWRTMQPTRTGRWIVTQPSGEYRTLDCRMVDDGNATWGSDTDIDPELAGFANYGINMVAEQPFWQGQTVTINWESQNNAAPSGPFVFWIRSSNAVFGARIENKGDVDAYPGWKVNAPFTDASVGVGTRQITLPFTKSTGYVAIDTSPTVQTATDETGADVTQSLGSVDFAPVPPGNPSQLNVTMSGTGSVDVSLTPSYYMAV